MKIKTINWITIVVILLQCLPGLVILISEDIGNQLIADSFGNGNQITDKDALRISKTFMMVFPFIGLGIASIVLGLNKIKDQETARKLCVYVAVYMGLFALPDVINTFTDLISQPIPLILINYACMGLLLYGSKKGTV
tara:strand:+ start:1075 stop:1488 length:414 start_codon:yes stop_codon:yes gene_type:complete